MKLEETGFVKVGLSQLVAEILGFDREKYHNSHQK